jgi:hypothetical protein
MTGFLQGLRAWYRRKFRGFVAAPAGVGGKGTSWQQHNRTEVGFTCKCRLSQAFTAADYMIREQEHREGCEGLIDHSTTAGVSITRVATGRCDCPVTDARYVRICPACGMGHWKLPPTAQDSERENR